MPFRTRGSPRGSSRHHSAEVPRRRAPGRLQERPQRWRQRFVWPGSILSLEPPLTDGLSSAKPSAGYQNHAARPPIFLPRRVYIPDRATHRAMKALQPGTRLGRYELLEAVPGGRLSEVFRARDTTILRFVAVKLLSAVLAADSAWLRRFEQEARAAGRLDHPNLLSIFDVGIH